MLWNWEAIFRSRHSSRSNVCVYMTPDYRTQNKLVTLMPALLRGMPQESTMVFFKNGIDGHTARADVWRSIWQATEVTRIHSMIEIIERIERIRSNYGLWTSINIRDLHTRLSQGWYYVSSNASGEELWCAMFNLGDMIRSFDLPESQRVFY